MRIQRRMTGLVCFVLFLAGPAAAWEPPRMPDPSAEDYDWRLVAHKHGLADGEVKALGRRKVLMTNEAFRQVFTPYVEADLPMFITSDSLLAAFHVLYEESVLRMEQAGARRLPEILGHVWRGLGMQRPPKDAGPMAAGAYRRARVVVGTALALLGEEPDGAGEDVARLVREEVRKILEARALDPKQMAETMPAWQRVI